MEVKSDSASSLLAASQKQLCQNSFGNPNCPLFGHHWNYSNLLSSLQNEKVEYIYIYILIIILELFSSLKTCLTHMHRKPVVQLKTQILYIPCVLIGNQIKWKTSIT